MLTSGSTTPGPPGWSRARGVGSARRKTSTPGTASRRQPWLPRTRRWQRASVLQLRAGRPPRRDCPQPQTWPSRGTFTSAQKRQGCFNRDSPAQFSQGWRRKEGEGQRKGWFPRPVPHRSGTAMCLLSNAQMTEGTQTAPGMQPPGSLAPAPRGMPVFEDAGEGVGEKCLVAGSGTILVRMSA